MELLASWARLLVVSQSFLPVPLTTPLFLRGKWKAQAQWRSRACPLPALFSSAGLPFYPPHQYCPAHPVLEGFLLDLGEEWPFLGHLLLLGWGSEVSGLGHLPFGGGMSNKNSSVTLCKYPGLLPPFLLPLPLCSNCLLNDPHSWLDVVPSTSPVSEVLWNCTLV